MSDRIGTKVPAEVVDNIVEALLGRDPSICECRRSPFDKHDVNPPCSTRKNMIEHVLTTLKMAGHDVSE